MASEARMVGLVLLHRVQFPSIQTYLLAFGPISPCWNKVQSFWRKRENAHAEGGGHVRTQKFGPGGRQNGPGSIWSASFTAVRTARRSGVALSL